MSNIDYREYKRLNNSSNLPKYDIGTPNTIAPGYQGPTNLALQGLITRQAELVVSPGTSAAKTEAVQSFITPMATMGKTLGSYVSAYNTALSNAMEDAILTVGTNNIGTEATKEGIIASAKGAAQAAGKSALGKAAGAANLAANAFGAVHGGIGMYNALSDTSSPFSAGDLAAMGGRSTNFANGVEYEEMGPVDFAGVNKTLRDKLKSVTWRAAGSGFEAGAGIGGIVGSFIPGASLIGSGIGAVVGTLGGILGSFGSRRRIKRALERAENQYRYGTDAYNTQAEAEAASLGMRLADNGLPISKGKANARVGALETLVGVNKNGDVTSAVTLPETVDHRYRADDYYVRLDKGAGVAGNKIDPFTGLTIAEKVAPLAEMFNAATDGKTKKQIGNAIKDEMALQDMLPDNNPNPYEITQADMGKNLKKCDVGFYAPAITNYLGNLLRNASRLREIKKDPIVANLVYADNPYTDAIGKLMPRTVNVQPELNQLTDALKHGLYNINQSGYAPGAKMALASKAMSDYMRNKTAVAASKTDRENEFRSKYAQLLSTLGESAAQRKQTSNAKYNDDLRAAYAQRRHLLDTVAKDQRGDWNAFLENIHNAYWGKKNQDLYLQTLALNGKELEWRMNANNPTPTSAPTALNPAFDPTRAFEYIMLSPQGLAMFNSRRKGNLLYPITL